jgi:hypothetical protein
MTEPTSAQDLFKGRHFDQEIIVLCVRWYLTFKLELSRPRPDDGRARHGSGANIIKYMFLSGEKASQILGGQDHGPIFGVVVAVMVSGLRLNCCFFIFSANWNAANRHGRRLESLESEHRPDCGLAQQGEARL